jgi:hypothetical protein
MADVPLRHPVPLRSTSLSSRPSTVRSSIFPRTPWHDPSSGGLPIGDGSLGSIQNSSEPMMTAIPEQLEEPTPDVLPSLPQPDIQQRRDVPTPLQVVIPEPDSFINPLGRQTSVLGAPFETRRQTPYRRHTTDQMELASLGQSPTHLNWYPQSAQEGSRPASRLNSFIVDPRLRNGTYSPGTRLRDCVNS